MILGDTRLELPDGWTCVSAIFAAPPSASAPALPSNAKPVDFRSTVSLAFEEVPPGTTAQGFLDAQLKHLRAAGEQIKLNATQPIPGRSDDALLADMAMVGPRGEHLRQIEAIAVRGTRAGMAVASFLDDERAKEWEKHLRPALERALP